MNNSLKPYLRFKEFDDSWREIQLGDIGSFKNGLNKGAEDFGFGVPFINLLDVFGKTEIDNPELKLVNASLRDIATYTVKKGDVFFIRSSVKRSGVGETVVARRDLENTVYSGFLIRYRATEQLNNNFKKYCFWTEGFRLLLVRFSTSSANTNINQESLSQLKLFIPKVDEQQKIADFLTVVDSKICQLTEKHRLLKEYKTGVMQQLFSQQVRFKDEDGKVFPDWRVERIGKYLELYKELVSVNTEIPILTSSRTGLFPQQRAVINDGDYGVVPLGYFTYRHMSDDLVFKFNVNRLWEKGAISKEYPVFKTVGMDSYYLETQLNEGSDFKRFAIQQKQGGTRTRLYFKNLKELKLNTPCLKEQQKIALFLQSIDKKIDAVALQIEQTKLFKKGLLQQMFV
jgi:type I restriction enzyme S subunit